MINKYFELTRASERENLFDVLEGRSRKSEAEFDSDSDINPESLKGLDLALNLLI